MQPLCLCLQKSTRYTLPPKKGRLSFPKFKLDNYFPVFTVHSDVDKVLGLAIADAYLLLRTGKVSIVIFFERIVTF